MLSPARRWALAAGNVVGTVILNAGSIAVVTGVVVLLVGRHCCREPDAIEAGSGSAPA